MLASLLLALVPLAPQQPAAPPRAAQTETRQAAREAAAAAARETTPATVESQPVVTHHEVTIEGKTLRYTATTGLMPLKNDAGETQARMFFVAYTLDGIDPAHPRPLMFSFNGGPGAASVWLHLGAIGPMRVPMPEAPVMPPPPYSLAPNADTWLDETDLVFIDPVGTGYSRPAKPELGQQYWGLRGDIDSVAEFIRLYLTRYERWGSPLFLVGESYGTTRAAGLSEALLSKGIALNGIVLISSVLNFQALDPGNLNDLPYVLYLPSFTATAWYHKRLAPALQADLHRALREAEQFASGPYAAALEAGDRMTPAARRAIAEELARLTGLSAHFIENSNLRVSQGAFCKELLRDEKRTVGRLDSRFTGIDRSAATSYASYDPSEAAVRPPFTAAFNEYVRVELGYKTDEEYFVLGGGIHSPWQWGPPGSGYPDVTEQLRSAMSENQYMRIFVAEGDFDLATPYYAAEYTLAHLELDPALRGNITSDRFDAGHMVYIHAPSLHKLKADVSAFIAKALQPGVAQPATRR